MPIHFHSTEGVSNPLRHAKKHYAAWLEKIAAGHHRSVEDIQYIFCDDDYLIEINRQYLNHDDYTDIITFPYSKKGEPIQSEIYISTERVKENAQKFGVSFHMELLRVMAHGLLHLIGYSDKDEDGALEMRKAEDECIGLFSSLLKISSS